MDNFLLEEHNYKKPKYEKYEKHETKDINFANARAKIVTKPNSLLLYDNKTYKINKRIKPKESYDTNNAKDFKVKLKFDFKNDKYKIKEKGDIKLNEWIMKQKDPLIVFISDIIPETKVLPHLEKIRPIIKVTNLMSIEEYRKRKKIGEEGVIYLKKLKEKYGNIILKTLWASLNL